MSSNDISIYIFIYISVNFILLVSMASTGLPPLPGSGKLKSTLIDADNPFRLPGDDHVFRMREEEVHIRNKYKFIYDF